MKHVPAVARKDYEDAVRSKMLWSLTGLLALLFAIVYVAIWYFDSEVESTELVSALSLPMQVVVPLAALIAGYMAVVGERRSGSIKILLGLPPTRDDVVVGKLLGRSGVIATAVLAALAFAVVLNAGVLGSVPLGEFAGLAVATLLLGLAFVGIAVGVSAAASSRGRAMAGVVGGYLLFLGFWNVLAGGLYRLIEGAYPPGQFAVVNGDAQIEAWALLVQRLNPMEAYGVVASSLLEEEVFPLTLQFPVGVPTVSSSQLDQAVAGDVPFYLSDWTAAVILLAWFVVPVALGYLRFRSVDLG